MDRNKVIQEFRLYLNENRDKLLEKAIPIEHLPSDDDWLSDSSWDEVYVNKVERNGKIQYWRCLVD